MDDDRDLVYLLKLVLARWSTVVAGDGQEALRLVQDERPDLIVLDLMLPDADGLAMITALHVLTPAPIIILTGRPDEVSRALSLDRGAVDFIGKPFDVDDLCARVEAALP